MKFEEAATILNEGGKVRCDCWPAGAFIYFGPDKQLASQDGDHYIMSKLDFEHDHWVRYGLEQILLTKTIENLNKLVEFCQDKQLKEIDWKEANELANLVDKIEEGTHNFLYGEDD